MAQNADHDMTRDPSNVPPVASPRPGAVGTFAATTSTSASGGAYDNSSSITSNSSNNKGPGHIAVGPGYRPALNDWKFPMSSRVATPAAIEHYQDTTTTTAAVATVTTVASSTTAATLSPAIAQLQQFPHQHQQQSYPYPSHPQHHQQQPDYFNYPMPSYSLTSQQELHQQLHYQQHQQPISYSTSNASQFRDGSQTPKSPYSFIGSSDGIFAENQFSQQLDSYSQLQQQHTHHNHNQSQDSVGATSIDPLQTQQQHQQQHPGTSHHHPHPSYLYQLQQHDAAQPGHIPIPVPDPELPQEQTQGPVATLSPHQLQTPSEFALKMLFTQFVKMAEAKLNAMVHLPLQDTEPDILSPLKHGVDPKFDKLLESLGSIAQHRPKPVIDCVMLWRKGKIESSDDPSIKSTSGEWSVNFKFRDPKTVIKERKSVVSLFIMSRSLIEIVRQVQKDSLPDELGSRLEETIFSQLENVDPEFIQRSSNRMANMNVLVELMGSLSNVRFATVSDRFIAELEKYKTGVPVKDKEREQRMEMLIRGMRYLNLKLYPMSSFEETADFLQSCARFFKMARGIRIKHAYAELFVQLLTPIAKVALAEVNHPNWSKTVELIYPKARKMTNKPRHVQVALPLVTILLCVSKKDFFIKHWLSVFESCREKFKDKAMRQIALNCASQLLWVYLYRCSDATGGTFRTLDTIVRALFPPNRKSSGMVEGTLGHFVRIVHYIGSRHADYATRSIIFLLLNLENLSNVIFTNLTMDMISPERMTIAVRSFMLILADLDKGGSSHSPPFPTANDAVNVISDSPTSSDLMEPGVINRAGMRDTYDQMTAVLGKIAIVCDRNYGHTLILDEKYTTARSMFSAAALKATATGDGAASIVHQYSTLAVSFSKEKQVYFDLMAAWVSCLPRCMPSGIPLVKLVEMLSRYTAHVDPELRKASAAALVRIAKQCNSQVVVAGYSEFVCTVEDRLSELLAGLSLPGSNTPVETGLLGIYIQILEAWIQDTTNRKRKEQEEQQQQEQQQGQDTVSPGALASPTTSTEGSRSFPSHVPEVSLAAQLQTTEENGLLFLCNQSPVIRQYAISILKIAAFFDRAEAQNLAPSGELKEAVMPASVSVRPRIEVTRIYHLLQNAVQELLQVDEYGNALKDCPLALFELIRLQIHHQKGSSEVFSLLAASEHVVDIGIWRFCFPLLIAKIFQHFPSLCEPCLDMVSKRLMQLYPAIVTTTDLALNSTLASKFSIKTTQVATDEMVEQWRTYLIYVCSTMVRHEHPSPVAPGHGRKKSAPTEKITCARDLFRLTLPLLSSDRHSIRESVVASLGRINVNLYKALLEDIQPLLHSVHDEFRSKSGGSSIKPPYQGKRNKKVDRLRAEIAHILDLTAPLLRKPALVHDEHVTTILKGYVRETLLFLLDTEVKHEWEFVKLRTHFCGFICHLYNGISLGGNTEAIITFDWRLALFKLFEEWSGHGGHHLSREDHSQQHHSQQVQHQHPPSSQQQQQYQQTHHHYNPKSFWFNLDLNNETQMAEKSQMELAALRAMASLCQGPINPPAGAQKPGRQAFFNIEEIFGWIESVYRSPEDRLQAIAQNALEALLIHNQDRSELLEDALHQCYAGDMSQKFIQGHFTALADIVLRIESYPCQINQMLCLALFKCGDSNIQIRTLAIKLLKVIEARYFPETCAGEYEIGIVNKLPTIYRQAQYVLSARLAQDRPEQTYLLLSEAMMRFDLVQPLWRGEMLYYIAPWLGNVELVVDGEEELSMTSFVILTNLFYLTVKYGDDHVKEIENLWVQLVAGDNFANIRPIIVFLLDLGLEKRNPEFVHPAKKVIVFLGRTSACSRMVDILISEISPKAMVPKLKQDRSQAQPPLVSSEFYLANLDSLMNGMEKRPAFSRGQLATVLLVDLAVEAGAELRRHLPLLLQALFVQLDHYTALICDQTRSLLVHLIHSIIIRESRSLEIIDQSTELVEFLNTKEGKSLWAYDDIISLNNTRESLELESLVYRSVQVFQASEVEIRQQWGETALQWATACPVRHIACRSFQIFRALAPSFNQHMLADMLARLSNTIGDKSQEIQAFAMEILISLQSIIESFDTARMMQFPQVFWASIACLYTGHDQEYLEGLKILDIVTTRLDLMDPQTLEFLLSYFPEHWDSAFMGIQPLLLKGLRSTLTEQISLRLLRRLMFVGENALIDPSYHRSVFLFLGILPKLAEGLETKDVNEDCLQWARDVGAMAERDGYHNISRLLVVYSKQRFRTKEDFWRQIAVLMQNLFIPELQAEMILFFMRLLYNSHPMYKHKALKCLKMLLPLVETKRTEFLEIGPELVMPLLRLLLQTDYATEALEVLDAVMNLTEQSTEMFKIRVPLDVQSPGPALNFEDMTKGVLGGGTGLERRSAMMSADPYYWSTSATLSAEDATSRRENFWQMTRANVNAVVLTCTGTGYWGTDVELLAEHEMMNYGLPMGIAGGYPGYGHQALNFVDLDGMHIGTDGPAGIYGLDRGQVQYGHLVSALDDLTEHFAASARIGDARKRESVYVVAAAAAAAAAGDPSLQNHWNYRHSLLISDPNTLNLDGTTVMASSINPSTPVGSSTKPAGDGLGLITGEGGGTSGGGVGGGIVTSGAYGRSHQRHSRHSSRASRDDFGGFYLPPHERIAEDDEEESSALMAVEILNKSLSINRSYSSIRSSFLMEPSSFNSSNNSSNEGAGASIGTGANISNGDNAAEDSIGTMSAISTNIDTHAREEIDTRRTSPTSHKDEAAKALATTTTTMAVKTTANTAVPTAAGGEPTTGAGINVTRGPNGRMRLYAPGFGHRTHRSSSGSGSGSGLGSGGASVAMTYHNDGIINGDDGNITMNLMSTMTTATKPPSSSGQRRRAGSSNAGSNSSSVSAFIASGMSASSSGTGTGNFIIRGHRARTSFDDLSLSSSDDDDDDDEDSTDSDDEDYDGRLSQHTINRYESRRTREDSFASHRTGSSRTTSITGITETEGTALTMMSAATRVSMDSSVSQQSGSMPLQTGGSVEAIGATMAMIDGSGRLPTSHSGSHAGSRPESRAGSHSGSRSRPGSTSSISGINSNINMDMHSSTNMNPTTTNSATTRVIDRMTSRFVGVTGNEGFSQK
ncbi:cell morphogenesis N-terminal-domain-containing protein [Lobosporangium transversale]|uniref:Cell morphogenesis N-terminal-domain-containing protein n=1 Tax=Lobosporangium transversale TaxID=64571 RepID=A0A1Y2GXQ0_9FUNG|nr:cell morphogenesis N-terminal-domain-containing protein [Lobosporangium transversale]ORZ22813.1 cell morphogenesis N-terminal-domain-containing protein [Lobosporangium transversale]|eukprot:XP_021883367.1 cell morphogenesis N-terminal-domain-containing protein [Lobosporangium transversale]